MEPYPHHYTRRMRVDELPINSNLHFILDELQKMETRLGDCIKGHCSGIKRRAVETERRAKERFITLKMAHAEADQGRLVMKKQFNDLKLEVHRMNRLLDHGNMVNSQGTLGLIHSVETTSSAAATTGPDGQRSASHTREHESRMVNPAHVPTNGITHTTIPLRAADSSLDSHRGVSHGAQFDGGVLVRVVCLSSIFWCFRGRIYSCGGRIVKIILRYMRWSPRCGLGWHLCILRGSQCAGGNRWSEGSVLLAGRNFVHSCMSALVETSTRH
jgi:hypothetical protein